MNIIACAFLAAGFFFVLTGAIGILRLPDFYTRLHAMGKTDIVGVTLLVLGVAILEGPTLNGVKTLFIIAFVGLASPTATHALGRAANRAGLTPWTASSTPTNDDT